MAIFEFLKFLKIKQSIIRGGREVDSYVMVWNIDGEQVSIMEM